MSNSEAAFYQIINTDALNHVAIIEPYPDMSAYYTRINAKEHLLIRMHAHSLTVM